MKSFVHYIMRMWRGYFGLATTISLSVLYGHRDNVSVIKAATNEAT